LEYFYGFQPGKASRYEPNLVRNTTQVLPLETPDDGYHLVRIWPRTPSTG
jgi:arylsulfatase